MRDQAAVRVSARTVRKVHKLLVTEPPAGPDEREKADLAEARCE